jgi:hypothetical protein
MKIGDFHAKEKIKWVWILDNKQSFM